MARPDRRPAWRPRLTPGAPPRRGIALVLVLWVLTLLTVIALGLTAAQRTETALADNHIAGARFRALAESAITFAMLSFLMPANEPVDDAGALFSDDGQPAVGPWVPNGVPRAWQWEGEPLTITVFNEQSRINLNTAQPDLLTALLVAVGMPDEDAAALADAIADFRDEDDLRLLNGAEDPDYEGEGGLGAKDAPFVAIEELQQVLGMTRDLYRRLAPELTVDGQGDQIDQTFASPAVLAALSGISLEEAELRVQERDDPLLDGTQGPAAVNRGGPLYRIQVEEQGGANQARAMEALVELTPGQSPPFLIRWRRLGLIGAARPTVEAVDPNGG